MRVVASFCLALVAASGSLAGDDERPHSPEAVLMRPAPPTATAKERMRVWHRAYRARFSPVRDEWKRLARAARSLPASRLTAGCRRLDAALSSLGHDRLPVAPDPSVSLHLEETLRALSAAARSCTHGAYFLTSWRLREADSAWRELRGRLQVYDLTP